MHTPLGAALSEAIAAEEASDWVRLRRVPSTYTWTAIDYLAGLDAAGRAAYAGAVIANAEALLSHDGAAPPAHGAPALRRLRAAMVRRADPRHSRVVDRLPVTEIRRIVQAQVTARYAATTEAIGGGAFRHAGEWRGQTFELRIEYGSGGDQLRYGVGDPLEDRRRRRSRVAYEMLVGVGSGHWDAVTAANLEPSIDLLCTLVERVVDLRRLAWW